jgi:hypothetical protein
LRDLRQVGLGERDKKGETIHHIGHPRDVKRIILPKEW